MYPEINLGPLTIQSFGLMSILGFWFGAYLASIRLQEIGKPREWALEFALCGMIGGVLGASINYVLQNNKSIGEAISSIPEGPGMVWFGGVAGFLLALFLWGRWRNFSGWELLGVVTPGIISVQMFGRLGCQLSGDGDYGVPWNGPWAMSYPNGTVPTTELVHPTPLYEALGLLVLLLVVWSLRKKVSGQVIFSIWMIGAGLIRFPVEFIRRNPDAFLNLTEAQWVSTTLIILGSFFLIRGLRKERSSVSD